MWNNNKIDSKLQLNGSGIPIKPIMNSAIVYWTTIKLVQNYNICDPELQQNGS